MLSSDPHYSSGSGKSGEILCAEMYKPALLFALILLHKTSFQMGL